MKRPTRTPKSEQTAQSARTERPPVCDIGVDLIRDAIARDPNGPIAKRWPSTHSRGNG